MVGRKTRQRTWFSGVHHCYVVGISNKLSGDPVVCSFIMISTRLSTLSSLFFSLRSCISLFFIPSHSMALCLPLPCSVSFSVSLWFRASPLPFFPWFSHYVPLFHPLLLNPNNTVPLVYTNDRQHTRVASTRILTRSRAWTRTVSTRCTKLVSLRRPSVQWNRRTSSRFSSHGCCSPRDIIARWFFHPEQYANAGGCDVDDSSSSHDSSHFVSVFAFDRQKTVCNLPRPVSVGILTSGQIVSSNWSSVGFMAHARSIAARQFIDREDCFA